jgi:nucleoid-associated protein YgaU
MKRILALMLVVGLSFTMYGCEMFGKKSTPTDQGDKAAIADVKPDTESKAEAAAPADEPTPAPEAAPGPGGRVHVVARGDTLYKLARQYYNGNQSMWRKILEANRDKIQNKDQLKPGMQLVIP